MTVHSMVFKKIRNKEGFSNKPLSACRALLTILSINNLQYEEDMQKNNLKIEKYKKEQPNQAKESDPTVLFSFWRGCRLTSMFYISEGNSKKESTKDCYFFYQEESNLIHE
jgi:hypothetical protein